MRAKSQGFSLLEIFVVLALLGIVVAWGASTIIQEYQRRNFSNDLNNLTYFLEQARSTSVKASQDQTVQIANSGSNVVVTIGTKSTTFSNLKMCVGSPCASTTTITYMAPYGEMCWGSPCTNTDALINFTRTQFSANLVVQGVFGYAAIRDLY